MLVDRLVFRPFPGWRIVAAPAAIDQFVARVRSAPRGQSALFGRIAPDDLFISGVARVEPAEIDDGHAIVAPESGLSVCWMTHREFHGKIAPFVEWPIPTRLPAFAQGHIAYVPAKVWLEHDHVVLATNAAFVADLEDRLR